MKNKSEPKFTSKEKVTRETLKSFTDEIESIEHSPRFQIVVTHSVLELLVNALVERKCKHGKEIVEDWETYPHAVKLILLHELKVISDGYFALLQAFRKIRNMAAHGSRFTLTDEMIEPFRILQDEPGFDTATNAHVLKNTCYNLVVGLWNQDKDFYYPYFRELSDSGIGDKEIANIDINYKDRVKRLKEIKQKKS